MTTPESKLSDELHSMKSAFTLMARFRNTPARLLLLAALLHVTVALTVFTVGRLQLIPTHFDANGIGAFASDGYVYRIEVKKLAKTLKTEGFRPWFYSPTQLHLNLYSLVAAPVQRWAEVSIATVEPLNLIYYLLLLTLVFMLGQEVFDKRAGLLAATIVASRPSLLLHTTQILKDPLVLTAILTFVLIIVHWLTRTYSPQRIVAASIAGALAILVIVDVRLAETLLTYLIEALAVIAFWQKRRQLAVWLLILTTILGATALGLIVVNIGSLYRLRYPFWILLVVLAAGVATYLLPKESRTQVSAQSSAPPEVRSVT